MDLGADHEITANVDHHIRVEEDDHHAVVFDFGTRVYYLGDDPAVVGLSVGNRVTLTATLIVEPYEYVEFLAQLVDFPALLYTRGTSAASRLTTRPEPASAGMRSHARSRTCEGPKTRRRTS